jgi:hypothetical protein
MDLVLSHNSIDNTRRPASHMANTRTLRIENQPVITNTLDPNITAQTNHGPNHPSHEQPIRTFTELHQQFPCMSNKAQT